MPTELRRAGNTCTWEIACSASKKVGPCFFVECYTAGKIRPKPVLPYVLAGLNRDRQRKGMRSTAERSWLIARRKARRNQNRFITVFLTYSRATVGSQLPRKE